MFAKTVCIVFVFLFVFKKVTSENKYTCPAERIKQLDTVTGRIISLDDRYQRKFPVTIEEIPKFCA